MIKDNLKAAEKLLKRSEVKVINISFYSKSLFVFENIKH